MLRYMPTNSHAHQVHGSHAPLTPKEILGVYREMGVATLNELFEFYELDFTELDFLSKKTGNHTKTI